MKHTLPVRVRLGPFELDLKAGELCRGKLKIILQEQPFQILGMLVERDGELVARDEIQKKLWPNDTVVEFDHSINAAIKKLRQALGDSADEPKYIETVARRGYRLLVRVERMVVAAKDSSESDQPGPGSNPGLKQGARETIPQEFAVPIGKKVSHYRVLEVIGGGGMGMVYKAEDLKLGRRVALKFLPEEMVWDTVALQRFQREAQTASSLNHPNICTIYEIDEYERQPFIAMELLEGKTLRDRLAASETTPLSLDQLLNIAMQACNGLEAAHEKGIIHRDIKPANIFLTSSGQVKILDFGLAKLVSVGKEMGSDGLQLETGVAAAAAQPAKSAAVDMTLTRLGVAMGTAGYMSPEQVRGEKLDARTDIFSFGLVLYEMVTGQRAFAGETAAIVLDAIVNKTAVPVRELRPELPPEFEAVISKALEKDRQQRYQSATELRNELEVLRSDSEQSGGRWSLWLATAVMVLLTAVVAAWFGWHRVEPTKKLVERQLTENPVDDYVIGAAISPDGKYLAYKDHTGLYLRSIDSGETRPITVPAELGSRIYHLWWFPNGGTLLAEAASSDGLDIWVITLLGEAKAHLLFRNGEQPTISPNGQMIAFIRAKFGDWGHQVLVGGVNGETPRKLVDAGITENLFGPAWSPDGDSIAYAREWKTAEGPWRSAIEVRPAGGGPAKTLVAEASLPSADTFIPGGMNWFTESWSPDWRLLFSLAKGSEARPGKLKSSLWQVRVDPTTKIADKPTQLTEWSDFAPVNLTVALNGKRLSFLKERLWMDLYLAEIGVNDASLKTPRRITLDNRGSDACAWTRDSRRIFFDSDRNGKSEIFRQGLNENVAEKVVAGPADVTCADMSPDGSSLLYWESESATVGSKSLFESKWLMRLGAGGGSPEKVLEAPGGDNLSCSSNPHASIPCALGHREGKDLVFYSLDPFRGKGRRLGSIEITDTLWGTGWSVSPDGTHLALVDAQSNGERIDLLTLSNGAWHEISAEPRGEHFVSIAWTADGKAFFVASWTPDSFSLLHVTLTGKVQSLYRKGRSQWLYQPVASPDGKHLAFQSQTWDSNIWMIDNF